MPNFHISSKGMPARCTAQPGNCPLKEDDGSPMPHFYDKDTAYQYIELKAEADAYNSGYKHSLNKTDSENLIEESSVKKSTSPKKSASKKKTVAVKVNPKNDGVDHEPGEKIKESQEEEEKEVPGDLQVDTEPKSLTEEEKAAIARAKEFIDEDEMKYFTDDDLPKKMVSDKMNATKELIRLPGVGRRIIYKFNKVKNIDDAESYIVSKEEKKSGNAFYYSEVTGANVDNGYYSSRRIRGHLIGDEFSKNDIRNLGFQEISTDSEGNEILHNDTRINIPLEDHQNLSHQEAKNLSDEERHAIYTFTSHHYSNINDCLYQNKIDYKKYKRGSFEVDGWDTRKAWATKIYSNFDNLSKATESIDNALEKAPKKQRLVYRGASPDEWPGAEYGNIDKLMETQFKPGSTIGFKGYQSTTTEANNKVFDGTAVFEIATPEGMNVSSESAFEAEKEVLLPRNQKYVVVEVRKNVKVGTFNRHLIRLVAVNSKGEILDGTNSDPIEPINKKDFKLRV